MLVLGVIRKRTVSLVWLSKHQDSDAKASSIYRRFQRFFAHCVLRPGTIGKLILSRAPRPDGGYVLAMDRTNWQFGKTHVNILVVSIIVGRVGLPVAWLTLPKSTKRGNSQKKHRIRVMEEVLAILPADAIKALTMDREFVGKHWLGWLETVGVDYVVRLKKNALVGGRQASHWCHRKRWQSLLGKRQEVFGRQVHFMGKRLKKGRDNYLAVISNAFQGEEALELYRMRWGIETLFGHLKQRGYQFEATHMTKKERIEKLLGVLTLAFALCLRWGHKLEADSPTPIKKHGYPAKSLFRRGFEDLHRILTAPHRFREEVAAFFKTVKPQFLPQNFVV